MIIENERYKSMNEEYKIEKNVPIKGINNKNTPLTRVFSMLKIGDSFLMEGGRYVTLYSAAKRFKIKITVRKQENNQVRIWRIK